MCKWKIPDPAYGRHITLVFGSHAEINRWADGKRRRDKSFPVLDESTQALFFERKSCYYILVSNAKSLSFIPAVLAHECGHLMFAVLREAGINYCQSSEEAFTYYLESIYAACWKKLAGAL